MTKVQDEAMTRLDSAVSEVFETMLERSCDPLEGEVDTVEGRIVATLAVRTDSQTRRPKSALSRPAL